ncbi:MAG: barstar family protein [Solirubrobacterales bacterium]|nr:barstar family protein [Solirubrobacterales bacterium]
MTSTTDLTAPPAGGFASVHLDEAVPGRAALEAAGIRVAAIDGAATGSKQDLMSALSEAMELPDWFGGNWDALDESLRDLSWLDAAGHVLVIEGGEVLWRRQPDLAGTLVSVWTTAASDWAAKGVPFHLVFVR